MLLELSPLVLVAASYFHEAGQLCRKPLWRISVCGPIVLVNPANRAFIASEPPPAAKLPDRLPFSNFAFNWEGRRWSMVLWPLIPRDPQARASLLLHERWHAIQQDLGLPSTNPSNAHLDTLEGRYWIRLEFRALARALQGDRDAVADALAFRAKRRSIFPKASDEERSLEMHEGLASYTGYVLSGAGLRLTLAGLANAEKEPSFVRSFAYATGPAYGILLDDAGVPWRDKLTPADDFGILLKIPPASELRVSKYDGESLRAFEEKRENDRQAQIAAYRKLLVEGPVVEFPNVQTRLSFRPNELVPVEGLGTIYPTLEASAAWGTLEVSAGALVAPDFSKVVVSLPAKGTGWKLTLSPGWDLVPGKREGDLVAARKY